MLLQLNFWNYYGTKAMKKIKFPKIQTNASAIITKTKIIDINAIILKTKDKTVKCCGLEDQKKQLSHLMPVLPGTGETIRFISAKDGFSSIAFIDFIGWAEGIVNLYVSTFRIGVKQAEDIALLYQRGRIKNAMFVTGRMKNVQSERYDYFNQVKGILNDCGFWMADFSNHSKVFLFETEKGNKYVLETSANLNENPQIEMYILSNSAEVFDFYQQFFTAVKNSGDLYKN